MTIIKQKANLEMRVVELEHLTDFNDLLRYVFQVTNSDLEAVGWKPKEIEQEKRPVLEKAHVLGWFDNDKLISQVATYPMHVNLHGKLFKMGGVTGVGTYPEYASFGLAKELILQALIDMKNNQQTISYLYPYSIPYYRKKGWEIISDKMSFTIPDNQLPKPSPVTGMVRRIDTEHADLKLIYNTYALSHHGALIRHELEWQEYWRWENDDVMSAIYYDQNETPLGYLFYHIANDEFQVKEIVCLNQEARKGIWNYISAHQSMVEKVSGNQFRLEPIAFLLEDSEIVEKIRPYFMARIVDVKAFLKAFPFKPFKDSICFCIKDPLLDFNTDYFTITCLESNIEVMRKQTSNHLIECDIQTLTTLLMNYRRPKYLHEIERLTTSLETISLLELIIPDNEPYFSDYF